MFTSDIREALRETLVGTARADDAVAAAALVGSGATGPGFRLLFGDTNPPVHLPPPDPERLVGMAWLYALHARSALARGRHWQAASMLDGVREQLVSLACLRHGLNPHQGRGVDGLPTAELDGLARVRATAVGPAELREAHDAAVRAIGDEAARHDAVLAGRLTGVLEDLRRTR